MTKTSVFAQEACIDCIHIPNLGENLTSPSSAYCPEDDNSGEAVQYSVRLRGVNRVPSVTALVGPWGPKRTTTFQCSSVVGEREL